MLILNVTMFFFLSFQIVKLMKPIVASSVHVVGNKDVDNGNDFCSFIVPSVSDSLGQSSQTHCMLIHCGQALCTTKQEENHS